MAKKTLNVKKTSKKEVEEKWGTPLPIRWPEVLYIRCNAKGVVNWEVAPVYQPFELVDRGNYNVINQ